MLKQSATSAAVQMTVAALLGLFALPAAVGGGIVEGGTGAGGLAPAAVAWLIGGLLVSVWLLATGPVLAGATAHLLEGLVAPYGSSIERSSSVHAGAGVAARWIVAVIEVVLIQAVLRRPVVVVVGILVDPSTVDAAFAAGTLVLLIVILIWLHQSTRPLVEAATWLALDALVATSGSDRAQSLAEEANTRVMTAASATERGADRGGDRTVPRASAEKTVAAPGVGTIPQSTGIATVARASEKTRLAAEDDPTVADVGATVRELAGEDSTVPAPEPGDATAIDPDATPTQRNASRNQ